MVPQKPRSNEGEKSDESTDEDIDENADFWNGIPPSPPNRRPPPPYGPFSHHFGPPPKPPFGRPPPFGGPPPFSGPWPGLPMRKEEINELRYFFILSLLAEFPEGITVYQLQEKYKMPRGNVIRILEDLKQNGYVDTQETVKDGRAQKLFSLTQKGTERLVKLKKQWAEFFSHMSNYAPAEEFANPFAREDVKEHFLGIVAECKSKEEVVDLVRGMRLDVTRQLNHIEERLKIVKEMKQRFDRLITFIEQQAAFDSNEIRKYMEKD